MSCRRGALAGAWVVVLLLGACSAKSSGKATAEPSGPYRVGEGGGGREAEKAPAAEESAPAEAGEELPALDARIDDAWHELRALDDAQREAAATDPGAAARCDRIRGLADEICTLSDRMCTLATEHPGERRYATACARSQDTCRSARQAAERCPAA